jgi:hypothetical protein
MVAADTAPPPGSHLLAADDLHALVWPGEGAVMTNLVWRGWSVLCQTPWSGVVAPSPAPSATEDQWVQAWRGGWQLCLPTTGQASTTDSLPAFHGRASQAPWDTVEAGPSHLSVQWTDPLGVFHATRRFQLGNHGDVTVSSSLRNVSDSPAVAQVAEHLILGGDFLAATPGAGRITVTADQASTVIPMDYSGAPTNDKAVWGPDWSELSASQGGRVFALVDLGDRDITVRGGPADYPITARLSWDTLPHLLVWQEFATSTEPPWNGEVLALGIEPTTTAHGLGIDAGEAVTLRPGVVLDWVTRLHLSTPKEPVNGESHHA